MTYIFKIHLVTKYRNRPFSYTTYSSNTAISNTIFNYTAFCNIPVMQYKVIIYSKTPTSSIKPTWNSFSDFFFIAEKASFLS